jgi:anti-anti-sigma factor
MNPEGRTMNMILGRYLAVEFRGPRVKVVHFTQPDLRPQLDAFGAIDHCELFRELQDCALDAGEGLVLNLGRLETFTSAFLAFLLRVRAIVQSHQGRLVLCQLRKEHREILEITHTLRLFHITRNEEEAVQQASG